MSNVVSCRLHNRRLYPVSYMFVIQGVPCAFYVCAIQVSVSVSNVLQHWSHTDISAPCEVHLLYRGMFWFSAKLSNMSSVQFLYIKRVLGGLVKGWSIWRIWLLCNGSHGHPECVVYSPALVYVGLLKRLWWMWYIKLFNEANVN